MGIENSIFFQRNTWLRVIGLRGVGNAKQQFIEPVARPITRSKLNLGGIDRLGIKMLEAEESKQLEHCYHQTRRPLEYQIRF
jgi:hypothetical protein